MASFPVIEILKDIANRNTVTVATHKKQLEEECEIAYQSGYNDGWQDALQKERKILDGDYSEVGGNDE